MQRPLAAYLGLQVFAARGTELGASLLNDAANVPQAERPQIPGDQPLEAITHAGHFETARDGRTHHGAYRRVHPRRIAAAGQDR